MHALLVDDLGEFALECIIRPGTGLTIWQGEDFSQWPLEKKKKMKTFNYPIVG